MKTTNINFIGNRNIALIFSGILSLLSIISLSVQGLQMGIDFTGGTLIEVGYQKPADLTALRATLDSSGFADATVQNFGTAKDVLIRLKLQEGVSSADLSNKVLEAINKDTAEPASLRRVEFVGPQVGDDLAQDGFLALLYSTIGILIYVAWRFEWKFSLGAIIATLHDVIVTLGVFSVLRMEFDLTVLAAVLALIGYSLNDTIVVYDRIRENFIQLRNKSTEEMINISVNVTLSRTIMTSLTVILVLVSLFFLGGEVIHGFSVVLLFGVFFGTYSSIFIASPMALILGVSPQDLIPVVREEHLDNLP
ncbi:protein translocase subunit SecF [Methylovulum psychrotolerans]|jgi:preprotein translocase subunit SecF|uniref:Protein-export membrane protein SecF n=1 Tax=Methylovulum psychrotolerans TaxID=1704499 RepID=A0A1Z4BYF1_9GAMM|nr:protein translocase subunit SecF [Methylovulum psychrotolerans]ASF46316.1 protein translocase subunit SecF [Methylovulum psychrotolerans]MBT9099002.1 protein translocase subunit SecF [Methylovulum psychrotolerans]POZ50974.1 protein translocase subunit SecF [Methylovulum psychrotolerans]